MGLALAIGLISGCAGGGTGAAKNGTVSGRIYDSATGAPIAGAKVCLNGDTTVTTDSSGHYSITWSADRNPAVGLAAWKDYGYSFMVFDDVKIDTTTNPVYNMGLMPFPADPSVYPTYPVTVKLSPAVTNSGYLFVSVRNSNGGQTTNSHNLADGTPSDTIDVYTGGPDCMVVVLYDPDTTDNLPGTCQYFTGQNLVAGSTNTVTLSASTGNVTLLNGVINESVQAQLITPGYGAVSYGPTGNAGSTFTFVNGGTATPSYDNPSSFPATWMVTLKVSKLVGTTMQDWQRMAISPITPQSPNVNLPPLPDGANDPVGVGVGLFWSPPLKQITFSSPPNTTMNMISLNDSSRHSGIIITNNLSACVLPGNLYLDVIESGTAWSGTQTPQWTSIADLSVALQSGSIGSMYPPGIQAIAAPSTTTPNLIP